MRETSPASPMLKRSSPRNNDVLGDPFVAIVGTRVIEASRVAQYPAETRSVPHESPIALRLVQYPRENRPHYAASIRCRFGGAYGDASCT